MSFELDCVKHEIFGGTYADLPTDEQFLTEEGFSDPFAYLEKRWRFPDPCYFVWCTEKQLEQIKKIDDIGWPSEEKKQSKVNGKPMYLLRVSSITFFYLRVAKRIKINGETGWLVKSVGKTFEKW